MVDGVFERDGDWVPVVVAVIDGEGDNVVLIDALCDAVADWLSDGSKNTKRLIMAA